jgi:hypothetical protein
MRVLYADKSENQEPDRNIEDLTDTEIFDAIRYLDPRYYILGWSNLDKIRSLEEEQRQVAAGAQNQARTITASKQRQDAATDRATKAGRMQSFRTFAEIDWHSTMARGEELEHQKRLWSRDPIRSETFNPDSTPLSHKFDLWMSQRPTVRAGAAHSKIDKS